MKNIHLIKTKGIEEALLKFSPLKYNGEMKYNKTDMIEFAKWQTERMYSEEEILDLIDKYNSYAFSKESPFSDNIKLPFKKWFEQFKKK